MHNAVATNNWLDQIVVHASGVINSCSGLFEGNHYRVVYEGCAGDAHHVKLQYRNHVNCDQGMLLTRKFVIQVPRQCREHSPGQVEINRGSKLIEIY